MTSLRVPGLVAATVLAGVLLDTRVPGAGQAAADLLAWTMFVWIWRASDAARRRRLILCVIVSTLGEVFLLRIWEMYRYRAGNLPLFVPAGHALAYAAADKLSQRIRAAAAPVLALALAPCVAWTAVTGVDRQAPLWYGVYVVLIVAPRTRALYASLFLVAAAIEGVGTSLGAWRYYPRDGLFGLSTTNPPLCAGGIYVLSIAMVLAVERALSTATPRIRQVESESH
jgi:hypothetical protein